VLRRGTETGGGYTRKLLDNANLRAKKLGEEAVELALACSAGDRAAVAEEAADLLYHTLVACHAAGVAADDVLRVLERMSERGA
jgi:phosphoribosyl-AMP cyclohydrolase / phosphoribosyl-ATP pyrophosphohydrolase